MKPVVSVRLSAVFALSIFGFGAFFAAPVRAQGALSLAQTLFSEPPAPREMSVGPDRLRVEWAERLTKKVREQQLKTSMPEGLDTPEKYLAWLQSPAGRAYERAQNEQARAREAENAREAKLAAAWRQNSALGKVNSWRGRFALRMTDPKSKLDLTVWAQFATTRKFFDTNRSAVVWTGPYTLKIENPNLRNTANFDANGQRTIERNAPASVQIWMNHRGYQVRFQGLSVNNGRLPQPDIDTFLSPNPTQNSLDLGVSYFPWRGAPREAIRGEISAPMTASQTQNRQTIFSNIPGSSQHIAWELVEN